MMIATLLITLSDVAAGACVAGVFVLPDWLVPTCAHQLLENQSAAFQLVRGVCDTTPPLLVSQKPPLPLPALQAVFAQQQATHWPSGLMDGQY